MPADSLCRIDELEACGNIGYEYGPEARRLIVEEGLDPEAVIRVALDFTAARSGYDLCLDMPDKVKATDHASRKLVMQAARLRVKANGGTLHPTPHPTPPSTLASVARSPRSREARGRRARSSSRASPDDPDLPRRCEYCAAPLDGRRPQTRTCSDSHRVLLHRRRRREKANA